MIWLKNNPLFVSASINLLLVISSCSNTTKNEQLDDNSKNKTVFSSNIIVHSDSTYGYEILKNNTIYIRQLNIPAISGNKNFKSKIQAQKVADLVVSKLNSKIVPPTISISEIDSLKILY
ncbi:MAG: DUF4907 domain-containing protein [Bacteroidota bacterium]|nr:DUF4907 domain-containing protein [Bacteroidota bacterium]